MKTLTLNLKRRVAYVAVTALFAVGAGVSGTQAAIIDLGFLLDESGSVGSTNYTTAKTALANALASIPTTGANQYRVGVVSFSGSATTLVTPTIVTGDNLGTIQSAITGDSHSGGTTNMTAGINQLVADFDAVGLGSTSLMNITTDGQPNSDSNASSAASDALAAGWDSISAEAIGSADTAFLLSIASPTPSVLVNPGDDIPNPLTNGFVITVANFDAYGDAIEAKVQRIVDSAVVPVPAALPLLLGGLGVLGFLGHRRKTAAA